jgi:hypothetical protein
MDLDLGGKLALNTGGSCGTTRMNRNDGPEDSSLAERRPKRKGNGLQFFLALVSGMISAQPRGNFQYVRQRSKTS